MKTFSKLTLILFVILLTFNCSKKPEPVVDETPAAPVTQPKEEPNSEEPVITEDNALDEADKLMEELENL